MRKSSKNKHKRGVYARVQRRIIMALSAGTITERRYLNEIAKNNRKIALKFGESGTSPGKLVFEAQKLCKQPMQIFDQIWCIFDVDNDPVKDINKMRERAKTEGIETIVSNPCFELWLVLHQVGQTGSVTISKIQKRAETLNLIDGKEIAATGWTCLFDNYEDAKIRAKDLDKMHRQNGSLPGSNPSSDVWRLVDVLRA